MTQHYQQQQINQPVLTFVLVWQLTELELRLSLAKIAATILMRQLSNRAVTANFNLLIILVLVLETDILYERGQYSKL